MDLLKRINARCGSGVGQSYIYEARACDYQDHPINFQGRLTACLIPSMFSPFDLPEGILLLITDELPSPADFALYQCLISHIKEKKNSLRIVLSVSEGLTRWQSVSAKSVRSFSFNLSTQLIPPDGPVEY